MVLLAEIGIPVKYGHSEVGYIQPDEVDARIWEQHEIELALQPLPQAADSVLIAQWLLRNLAQQGGLALQLRPDPAQGPRRLRPALPPVAGHRRRAPEAQHARRPGRGRRAGGSSRAWPARRRADGVRQPRHEFVRATAPGQGGAQRRDVGVLQPPRADPPADRGDRRGREVGEPGDRRVPPARRLGPSAPAAGRASRRRCSRGGRSATSQACSSGPPP